MFDLCHRTRYGDLVVLFHLAMLVRIGEVNVAHGLSHDVLSVLSASTDDVRMRTVSDLHLERNAIFLNPILRQPRESYPTFTRRRSAIRSLAVRTLSGGPMTLTYGSARPDKCGH